MPGLLQRFLSKRRDEITQKNGGFAPPAAEMTWRDECKRGINAAIIDTARNVSPQVNPIHPANTNQ